MGYCITKPYDERLGTEQGYSITNAFYATDFRTDRNGVCYVGEHELPAIASTSESKMDYATRLTNFDGGSVDDGVVFLELYRCRDVKISPSVHFLYMKDCADIEVPESVLVVSTDNCRNISLPKSKYDSSCFNPKSDNVHTNVSKKCYEALMSKIDELSLTLNPTEKIDLSKPSDLVRVAVEFRNELLFRDWITPSLISKEKADQIIAEARAEERQRRKKKILKPFKIGCAVIAILAVLGAVLAGGALWALLGI